MLDIIFQLFLFISNFNGNCFQGLICAVFTLMVTVAESHSHLLLDSLLMPEGSPARNTAMRLIQGILQCSNMPGQYPLDESCSQMAFGFWYMLQVWCLLM